MTASISSPHPIRLLIADDSELVRTGLRTLLTPEKSIRIVAEAGSVSQAVTAGKAEKPDVVLMDIRLPDGTGFEACRRLLEAVGTTRVIFLTSVVEDKLVDEALRSGGVGYLLKEINGACLIQAIQDVAAGKPILDPAVTTRLINMIKTSGSGTKALDKLSPQERRVISLVAEGKSNKEVGSNLNLSEKTVRNYLANIFDKLNVSSRGQAAAQFLNNESRAS